MNVRDLGKRLSRLEAAHHGVGPIRGVSGVLLACARYRAGHHAPGASGEDRATAMSTVSKPPWAASIRAAMARYRETGRT